MSYENNRCPCGNRKPRETMLCHACAALVAGSPDAITMADEAAPLATRRRAAVRILSRARTRNHPPGARLALQIPID